MNPPASGVLKQNIGLLPIALDNMLQHLDYFGWYGDIPVFIAFTVNDPKRFPVKVNILLS